MKVFSYGGGVQSTAALVLAVQGRIDYRTFLFANTGDDSENPHTLRYIREVAMPYAEAYGLEIVEVQKRLRDGTPDTLLRKIDRTQRSIPIPVRLESGAFASRACTVDFKIGPVNRWLKAHGMSADKPFTVGLGISLDEMHRARSESDLTYKQFDYPLIHLEMTRQDCVVAIERGGLPVPPKSACFFCPHHRITEWNRLRRDEPDLFAKSVALERKLNDRRERLGLNAVRLSYSGRTLEAMLSEPEQMTLDKLWGGDVCDAGHCFT